MIVEIVGGADERPEVRVVDVDDLGALHLALGEVTDAEAEEALSASGLGRLQDQDTGFLDVEALRAAGASQASAAGWSEQFDAMVDHAREEGRLADDGASLQVRVESAAGA